MNRAARQSGFTLLELSLAMTFIAVLLLAIAMTVIQISTTYTRGLTLRETNEVARSVSTDIQQTVAAGEAFSLTDDYYTTTNTGRFCTGTYTYVWNYGAILSGTDTERVVFIGPRAGQTIRLVKFSDPTRAYCARDGTGLVRKDILEDDADQAQELIKPGDRSLALHRLALASSANATDTVTGQQIYQLDFTLGTNVATALEKLPDGRTHCKDEGVAGADLAYCSVQDFSLVVRAGNRVN